MKKLFITLVICVSSNANAMIPVVAAVSDAIAEKGFSGGLIQALKDYTLKKTIGEENVKAIENNAIAINDKSVENKDDLKKNDDANRTILAEGTTNITGPNKVTMTPKDIIDKYLKDNDKDTEEEWEKQATEAGQSAYQRSNPNGGAAPCSDGARRGKVTAAGNKLKEACEKNQDLSAFLRDSAAKYAKTVGQMQDTLKEIHNIPSETMGQITLIANLKSTLDTCYRTVTAKFEAKKNWADAKTKFYNEQHASAMSTLQGGQPGGGGNMVANIVKTLAATAFTASGVATGPSLFERAVQ